MTVVDDKFNFSDEQDIAASSLSASAELQSTNLVDFGVMKDVWGVAIVDSALGSQAKKPVVVLSVGNETFTGASATVLCRLMSHTSASSIKSGTEHSRTIFPALSAQDAQRTLPVPVSGTLRYMAVIYKAVGGTLTAGYMNAYLAEAAEHNEAN